MRGSYVLLVHVERKMNVEVGAIGKVEFRPGYYAYVGSAMSSLEGRLSRHFRRGKKLFWHIDYLLANVRPVKAFYIESNERLECVIAEKFARHYEGVAKFGSSDCSCRSHMFYMGTDKGEAEKAIKELMFESGNMEAVIFPSPRL